MGSSFSFLFIAETYNLKKIINYNNDVNFLDGYLIAKETFHTDKLSTTSNIRQCSPEKENVHSLSSINISPSHLIRLQELQVTRTTMAKQMSDYVLHCLSDFF